MVSRLKIQKLNGSTPVDSGFDNPEGSSNTYGVVGGATGLSGQQILTRVAIGRNGTGTITASTTSNALSGSGTNFDPQLAVGSVLATTDGTVIGFISSITNDTTAVLTANAAVAVSSGAFVYATNHAGYVLRQKGKRKYLVADATAIQDEDIVAGETYRITDASGTDWSQFGAGPDAGNGKIFTATIDGSAAAVDNGVVNLVGQCKTANLANSALTPNSMNLVATKAPSGTVRLDSLTSHQAIDFTDNGTDQNAGTHYYASTNGAIAAGTNGGQTYMVVDIQTT